MVSKEPTPTDLGAAPYTNAEAARSLRLLRDHRQLLQPPGIPGGGSENLETLAVAATPCRHDDVERVPASGEAIRPPEGARRAQPARWRREAMRRRARCGKSARLDLWEPWVRNHPGRPGPS